MTHATWWNSEGSGMRPLPNEDIEEFAKRITEIAWSNGAYEERDACVAVCERHAKVYSDLPKTLVTDLSWAACIDIRDSIKRRGEA